MVLALASAWTVTACGTQEVTPPAVHIIPQPASITTGQGVFKLKSGMTIAADSSLERVADYLDQTLRNTSALQMERAEAGEAGNINLRLGLDHPSREAYTLTVDADGITIQGATPRGVQMGIATLRQLIPVDSRDSRIPYVTISDAPRFEWRGALLDVSRHFYTPEQVKRFLDLMARYKLNKFHWHLTDDQGWRIEIKQYPLLTERGAWRKLNSQDSTCLEMAAREDNPDMLLPQELMRVVNGDTLYGGYYTQQEIRDIVAYAAERGVTLFVFWKTCCPNNIEFIRRINGLDSVEEVAKIVFDANYIVMGLGDVYLGAPVATPLDPRRRLVTTKYNPARTWTPENAVGIGGEQTGIYPLPSPGGWQLIGTTPVRPYDPQRTPPVLFSAGEHIRFVPVTEDEYLEIEEQVRRGEYVCKTTGGAK